VTCGLEDLTGKTISSDSLSATITDVLVQVSHVNMVSLCVP